MLRGFFGHGSNPQIAVKLLLQAFVSASTFLTPFIHFLFYLKLSLPVSMVSHYNNETQLII